MSTAEAFVASRRISAVSRSAASSIRFQHLKSLYEILISPMFLLSHTGKARVSRA